MFEEGKPLEVQFFDGHVRRFKTLMELVFFDEGGTGATFRVPAGTESDGASVPRGLWNFASPYGVYLKSAVLHDYLYQQGTMSRKQADAIFLRAMEGQNVGKLKRRVMHGFVRGFGGFIWRRRHGKK